MIAYYVRMVEFRQDGDLFEKFKGFWIIIINDHFLNSINVGVNSVLAAIDTSEPTLADHFEFLVIDFIATPWIWMFRNVILKGFLNVSQVVFLLIITI